MSALIRRWPIAFLTLVVFLTAAGVYRFTLTYVYSSDDIQYAILIETFAHDQLFYHPGGGRAYVPQWQAAPHFYEDRKALINPRYLLEWPTSLLAAKVWQAFGWDGSVIVPIQAIRILVGAAGLALFFYTVQQYLNNIRIAMLATIGLGLSAAYWTYSIHLDQSINMMFWLFVALFWLLRMVKHGFSLRGKALLALLLALASFYNFTALFSAFAFAFAVALFHPDTRPKERFKQFIGFGVAYGVICVLGVLLAIAVFVSPGSLVDPLFWRGVFFGGKPEYAFAPLNDGFRAIVGLAKSQTVYPGVSQSFQEYFSQVGRQQQVTLIGFFCVIFAVMMLPFVYIAFNWRTLKHSHTLVIFLLVWVLAHSLFNWFWDPGFNKYWLIPLLACWFIVALALHDLKQRDASWYYSIGALSMAFVGFTAGINLTTQFLPQNHRSANPWLEIAHTLNEQIHPADLFITTYHPLDFILAYLTHTDVVSTGLISYDQGGTTGGITATLQARVRQHQTDGGAVYLYGFDTLGANDLPELRQWYAGLHVEVAWQFPDLTIYRLLPN